MVKNISDMIIISFVEVIQLWLGYIYTFNWEQNFQNGVDSKWLYVCVCAMSKVLHFSLLNDLKAFLL